MKWPPTPLSVPEDKNKPTKITRFEHDKIWVIRVKPKYVRTSTAKLNI